jgi:type II secretory pathway pseudopilin PulG
MEGDVMSIRNAFTLVELLVMMAIMVLLIAILLPVLGQARERANRIKCAGNLRQLGLAFQMYHREHKQYPRAGWSAEHSSMTGLPFISGLSFAEQ